MGLFHHHDHDSDHEHGRDHGLENGNADAYPAAAGGPPRAHGDRPRDAGGNGPFYRRVLGAVLVAGLIAATASLLQTRAGEASVVTRFGNPVRIVLRPGLTWRLPPPFESVIPVDLRLRTTSSGLQDVGTRDGLRVIMQAYVAWRVPRDAAHVERFLRAVENRPEEAARQIRTFVGSALQTTTSGFDLASLVNTDASQVRLSVLERQLRDEIERQLLDAYGIEIAQVGIERLTLPAVTLAATVERMRAERETIAAQRMAEGRRAAAEIHSNAQRDARIVVANAGTEAARIEAEAKVEAAKVYGAAYALNPRLYTMLRSLDTLNTVFNGNTHLILRTDAAPFNVLVDGPPQASQAAATMPKARR